MNGSELDFALEPGEAKLVRLGTVIFAEPAKFAQVTPGGLRDLATPAETFLVVAPGEYEIDGQRLAVGTTRVQRFSRHVVQLERPLLGVRGNNTAAGFQITGFVAGSPAESAGLRTGLIVESVDGVAVAHAVEIAVLLREKKPGDVIELQCYDPAEGSSAERFVTRIRLGLATPEGGGR
jgi:S1-C subfamily serine protease